MCKLAALRACDTVAADATLQIVNNLALWTVSMKFVVWGLVLALIVLHQDNWNWTDTSLVGGFMPKTLLYHAGISLAAGIVWFMATIFAWPVDDGIPGASSEPAGEDRNQKGGAE